MTDINTIVAFACGIIWAYFGKKLQGKTNFYTYVIRFIIGFIVGGIVFSFISEGSPCYGDSDRCGSLYE